MVLFIGILMFLLKYIFSLFLLLDCCMINFFFYFFESFKNIERYWKVRKNMNMNMNMNIKSFIRGR